MRFMIIRKADPDTEAGAAPTQELAAAMMQYHEEMGRALKILGGDGLRPTSEGARVSFKGGRPLVTDGPFAETKELIAGYTVVEADSFEEVVAWAKRWPAECDGGDTLQLEIRRLYEIEDFGEAFTPELKAQHDRVFSRE
jgi:hypothetical protein